MAKKERKKEIVIKNEIRISKQIKVQLCYTKIEINFSVNPWFLKISKIMYINLAKLTRVIRSFAIVYLALKNI